MRKVSIIIPAYNEESFIGTLLEKILQVPTESVGFIKEIVVVDDGSTDKTAMIAGKFPKVTVIQQHNQGKGAAVQRGIKDSTGDFILVQDAELTLLLYGRWLTDLLTAYKIYPALIKNWVVRTHGFETDHELTAKLVKAGISIVEVPVSYTPRSLQEGKKIRPRDGLIAVLTLFKYRVVD